MSDLRAAHVRGYISKVPHFNSISNYLENPKLTSDSPQPDYPKRPAIGAVETDFAG